MLNSEQKRALQYVLNTGENVNKAQFDEDHEPIGPLLRRDLMPLYLDEKMSGKLYVTEQGHVALK